jgi:ubiquitin-protein ligase
MVKFYRMPDGEFPQEPPEGYADPEPVCVCPGQIFRLDIDAGQVCLVCRDCGLSPGYPEWQDALFMEQILVRLVVEKDEPCVCHMRDQMSCDCGTSLVAQVISTEKELET